MSRTTWTGWLLCAPALAIFGIFFFGPALVGLIVSLHKWNGTSPMTFVGWGNYAAILSEPRFWNACAVTFAIYVAMLVLKLPLALLLAVGLVKAGPGKRLYRTALFLPYVLSTTTVAIIWIFLLDPYQGLVNFVLREVGLAQWQQGCSANPIPPCRASSPVLYGGRSAFMWCCSRRA